VDAKGFLEFITKRLNADHLAAAWAVKAREALRKAKSHVAELEEAWRRGAIHETDSGGNGTRSNRNVDVRVALANALSTYPTEQDTERKST
jgi:hypothetical protein